MPIHPMALIATDAVLAPDVEVGPFTVIGSGVTIAEGCRVGPHVVIEGPTSIGPDNQIFQFASIGAAPQDLKYKGEPTRLEIGARNVFRENCTINRGTTKDQLVTRIGDDNLFMSGSHVGHDCVIGSRCVFANYGTLGGHVEIGDWVHLGGFAGVHQFCKVGAHAFIANNTAVTRDVPPFVMAVGRPAEAHSVNAEGLKRRGFTPEQIRNLRNAYRTLFRSKLKLAEAMAELKERATEQPELLPLVEFLHETTARRQRVGIVR
jgi:UDP-N-acetylglucosamine acyltransferase